MKIEEIGYVFAMRQQLGLKSNDTSKDAQIEAMSPMQRVCSIVEWYDGDPSWVNIWKGYFESQGIFLTTDPTANGIIE